MLVWALRVHTRVARMQVEVLLHVAERRAGRVRAHPRWCSSAAPDAFQPEAIGVHVGCLLLAPSPLCTVAAYRKPRRARFRGHPNNAHALCSRGAHSKEFEDATHSGLPFLPVPLFALSGIS